MRYSRKHLILKGDSTMLSNNNNRDQESYEIKMSSLEKKISDCIRSYPMACWVDVDDCNPVLIKHMIKRLSKNGFDAQFIPGYYEGSVWATSPSSIKITAPAVINKPRSSDSFIINMYTIIKNLQEKDLQKLEEEIRTCVKNFPKGNSIEVGSYNHVLISPVVERLIENGFDAKFMPGNNSAECQWDISPPTIWIKAPAGINKFQLSDPFNRNDNTLIKSNRKTEVNTLEQEITTTTLTSLSAKQGFFLSPSLPQASAPDLIDLKKKVKIPQGLICPITDEIFENPVLYTLDGRTYERTAITQWLEKNRTSPYSRDKMSPLQSVDQVLIPNRAIIDAIDEFKQDHPELSLSI